MPPNNKIEFLNSNTLIIVSSIGNIKQLYTPIRAMCIHSIGKINAGTTVFIEAVGSHPECRICYQICHLWYSYENFIIN